MIRRTGDEFFGEGPDNNSRNSKNYNRLRKSGEAEIPSGYMDYESDMSDDGLRDDFDEYDEAAEEEISRLEVEKNQFKVYVRNSEKTTRNLKIVIAVLTVTVLLLVGFIIFIVAREYQTKSAFFGGSGNLANEAGRVYYTQNLKELIDKEFSSEQFKAEVVLINTLEYLCFSTSLDGEDVKIYYQNSFKSDSAMAAGGAAYMEKGNEKIKLSGGYDITKPNELVPSIIQLSDRGTGFLFIKRNNGVFQTLITYNVTDFQPVSSIDLSSSFKYYFKLSVVDEEKKLVDFSDGNITYRYQVSDESLAIIKNYEAEEQKKALDTFADMQCELIDNTIKFRSFVSINEREYLGEYSGDLTFSSTAINLVNARFAAYAGCDYEDEGNGKIITPTDTYLEERVIISGKDNGKYAFPLYDKLSLSTLDKSHFIRDEATGYIKYSGNESAQAGIDISKYQGKADWVKIKAAGFSFGFIRGGYRGYSKGNIVEDEYALINLKGAKAAGVNAGVYFFTQAINVKEAEEEAVFSVNLMKKAGYDKGVIVFDTESYDDVAEARGNKISREERTKIAVAFAKKVKDLGYTPVIYVNTRWAYLGVDLNELSDYDIWYACYGTEMLLPYDFAIWQYSDKGVVDGVSGNADLNIMFKDVFK
ncbi:MAG: glycoside hydrolase family 25 protein [Clostridiales bacterium]|nr:glycoside hydrolase family 25 protein [Clostridiales bacterium]